MRVPKVLGSCKASGVAAVVLMTAGTYSGSSELRAWALLFGVLAAGLCITAAVQEGVETIKDHLTKYVFKVFEDGFRGGVEQGREMEATQQFIASVESKR